MHVRKRCATAWRDARDEIGGGLGFAHVAAVVPGGGSWGGRGMLGVGVPSVVTGLLWTVSEAVSECGAGISVAGHARCCCERVCQSPD